MKVTYIGYFGRTANVKNTPLDAAGVDAFAAAIVALPRRTPGAEVISLADRKRDR
jgi:hypothetical protein